MALLDHQVLEAGPLLDTPRHIGGKSAQRVWAFIGTLAGGTYVIYDHAATLARHKIGRRRQRQLPAFLLRLGDSTATQGPETYTVTGDAAVKVVPYSMHSMQPQLLAPAQHPQEQ